MKSADSFVGSEAIAVAKIGDGDALDQLHDEIGAGGDGRAGIEYPGDVLVIHDRQRLPFGLETVDYLLRVHPGLDDLERDLTPHRPALLRQEDGAHAPLADFADELIRTDQRSGAFTLQRGR